jgi:hypothetical protein
VGPPGTTSAACSDKESTFNVGTVRRQSAGCSDKPQGVNREGSRKQVHVQFRYNDAAAGGPAAWAHQAPRQQPAGYKEADSTA